MNKRILFAILVSTLLLLGIFAPTVLAAQPPVDPTTLIFGSIGLPYRADPATAYDTGSGSLIMNVYEPLIDFDRNTSEPDPRKQGLTGEFVPRLAKDLPTKEIITVDLNNITLVNESDPKGTKWSGTEGKFYHINGWRDNNPDGTLGLDDVIYMEEINASTPPYEWIPCTKFAWQVTLKEYIGSIIHLLVQRTWYIFELRQGVKIHPWLFYNGTSAPPANLTTEDVEYSFERALVQDRLYGPTWMLYKPMLDMMNAEDGWDTSDVNDLTDLAHLIDCAIQQNGTHVWVNMGIQFPEIAWFQILAQTWGCIVPKAFAVDHGCWPGTFFNASGYPHWIYWRRWPTISRSPLDRAPTTAPYPGYPVKDYTLHAEKAPVLRGTGPYKSTTPGGWDPVGNLWRIDRFLDYWGGWDPYDCHPYFVDTYIMRNIELWPPRLAAFLAGDIDIIVVPRAYMSQLLQPNGEPLLGVVCYKDIPQLTSDSLHYQLIVTEGSSYMPTIGGVNQSGFFGNVHARRAFSYALNFTELIEDAWFNEAEQPTTWHIANLVPDYRLPPAVLPPYDIDLTKCEAELKLAKFDGVSLWDSGFKTYLVYNLGNDQRKIACDMIKVEIEGLNALRPGKPPFVVDVVGLPWSPDYLTEMESGNLPCFQIGWLTDFADVDNWVRPYMHTYGDFSHIQGYSNITVDTLIDLGVKTSAEPDRRLIYEELQREFIRAVPTLMIVQPWGRAWMRNWVQGWYNNDLFPGAPIRDRWKGFKGDLNRDMIVNIFDLDIIMAQFGRPPPPITDPRTDINGDGVVDIFDLIVAAVQFGAGIP